MGLINDQVKKMEKMFRKMKIEYIFLERKDYKLSEVYPSNTRNQILTRSYLSSDTSCASVGTCLSSTLLQRQFCATLLASARVDTENMCVVLT